ncbi:MAG: Phage capsid family [Actinomycetota bacterium]|jgi:HK97 family phage major capsid protein
MNERTERLAAALAAWSTTAGATPAVRSAVTELLAERASLAAQAARHDAAMKGGKNSAALRGLAEIDGKLVAQRQALSALVGADAARDMLGESLRAVLRPAIVPGFDLGEDGHRSLLTGSLGGVATEVGRDVIAAVRTHDGLVSILPSREWVTRGVGALKLPTLTARPILTDPATEGAAIGTETSPTFGAITPTWSKAGAWTDYSYELFTDAGIANPEAWLESVLVETVAATIEAKASAALFSGSITSAAAAAAGAPVLKDVTAAASVVRSSGWTPTHAVMSPTVWAKFAALEAPTGQPVAASVEAFRYATSLTPVLSSAAPSTEVLVIDATPAHRVAELHFRTRPEIELSSTGATFAADLTRVKLALRYAIGVQVPGGARRITGC